MKILDADGLHLGADSISYAKVFAYLEETKGVRVTRGSVHERIWASHEDFRREALERVVALHPADYVLAGGQGLEILKELARRDLPPKDSVALMARRFATVMIGEMLNSPDYRRIQSIKAMASRFNDPETSETMAGVLSDLYQGRLTSRRESFEVIVTSFGLQPRPALGLSIEQTSDLLYSTIWALATGGFLNARAGCESLLDVVPGDLDSWPTDEPWTVFGVGIKALVDLLLVPAEEPAHPSAIDRLVSVSDQLSDGEFIAAAQTRATAVGVSTSTNSDSSAEAAAESRSAGSTRRRRSELKELVLGGAIEMLMRDGVRLRPESLSYAAVFAKVKEDHGLVVNRASVHRRFWASHEEFCLEVLARGQSAAAPADTPIEEALMAPLRDDSNSHHSDRREAVNEAIRAFGEASLTEILQSPVLRRRLLIKATVADQPEGPGRDMVCDAVVSTDQANVARRAELLGSSLIAHGYEVRPELGLPQDEALVLMAVLVHAVTTGIGFDVISGGTDAEPVTWLPAGSTESEPWSVVAVVTCAVFELLFQPKD